MLGVRPPSMYHLVPLCTPLICQRLHVPSTVKGQVDHTISRRCAAEYAPAARILCSTLPCGKADAQARRARIGPWPRRPARSMRSVRPARVAAAAVAARAAIAPRPRLEPVLTRPAWPEQRIAQSHGRQISAACSLPAVPISQQPRARVNEPGDLFAKQALTPWHTPAFAGGGIGCCRGCGRGRQAERGHHAHARQADRVPTARLATTPWAMCPRTPSRTPS